MPAKHVAVIMAGGSGERFWPLSRKARPKQLLNLTRADQSLLDEAVERIAPVVGNNNVYVATGRHLVDPIRDAELGIPAENILAEPCKRNTAGCLCYVAAVLLARNDMQVDGLTMAVLTADHEIRNPEAFRKTVEVSLAAAEQNDSLVTIGVRPTRPETGYGYIEMNNKVPAASGSDPDTPVYPVVQFLEKPDGATAERFAASGKHLWNSGMFFWRVNVFLEELRSAHPEMVETVMKMAQSIARGDDAEADALFAELPDISIDYALMEKAPGLLVTPARFQWDDMGAWDALDRTFGHDDSGNVAVGEPVLHDARDCIVYNEPGADKTAVAVIGVEDLVVVVSDDAVLVVPKDRAQDVKTAVAKLKERDARQL